ncbi:membrane protein [Mycobacterium phage Indlulamithi]|uniref:Uncharacterized protein n=1 Tax=Mycobacterium phage Indlulamithi TaxID=2656582 RepID=A0A649VDC5_9CAUD|nr:membrane protein [Mycobacterium phage Indlulamithi]QGJ90075.1 hypothetical protein PBI_INDLULAMITHI_34 [Mycobacterium phage Indlulamithi]
MKEYLEGAAIVVAALVSLAGAYISIRNRKTDTKKVESETNLNEAQQASIVKQLANSTEEMYLKRIDSFKDDIKLLRDELRTVREDHRKEIDSARKELAEVRDEAALLEEYFFQHHVPWDREAAREIQKTNPQFPEPPSWLIFLRGKQKEKGESE